MFKFNNLWIFLTSSDRKVDVTRNCSITRNSGKSRLLNSGIIPVTRRVDKCSNFADVTTPFSLDDRSFSWRDFDAPPPCPIVLRFTEWAARWGCWRRVVCPQEIGRCEGCCLRFIARHTPRDNNIIPLSRQSLPHPFDTRHRINDRTEESRGSCSFATFIPDHINIHVIYQVR